ncbi:hypothetical protein JCM5353_002219 [Sporobolomyces roseus]
MSQSARSGRSSYSSDDGRSFRRPNRLDLKRLHQSFKEKLDPRKPKVIETVDSKIMQEVIERRRREEKQEEARKLKEKAEKRKRELEEEAQARKKKAREAAEAQSRKLRKDTDDLWAQHGVATLVRNEKPPTWRDHLREMRKSSHKGENQRYKHRPTNFQPVTRDPTERATVHIEQRHSQHSQHSQHHHPASSHHSSQHNAHSSNGDSEVDRKKASSGFESMREPLVHERKFNFPTPEEEHRRRVERSEHERKLEEEKFKTDVRVWRKYIEKFGEAEKTLSEEESERKRSGRPVRWSIERDRMMRERFAQAGTDAGKRDGEVLQVRPQDIKLVSINSTTRQFTPKVGNITEIVHHHPRGAEEPPLSPPPTSPLPLLPNERQLLQISPSGHAKVVSSISGETTPL